MTTPTNIEADSNFLLIETGDGSSSIFLRSLSESYHSKHGAVTESRHVFLRNGFFRLLKNAVKLPVILEVGLGSGLNMALTYEQCCIYNFRAHYIALEPHPLPIFLSNKLNYAKFLDARSVPFWKQLHHYKWNCPHRVDDNFCFTKLQLPIEKLTKDYVHALILSMDKMQLSANTKAGSNGHATNNINSVRGISLVYYDAFSPKQDSQVWHSQHFQLLRSVATVYKPTVLTTFSASRIVRDNLANAGWLWQKMPGILGKKEITVATTLRP